MFTQLYNSLLKHIKGQFLVNKTNRCTEFQFYWYYYYTCFGQPFCPSSGVLSCTSALVHFMKLWPVATRNRMEQFHPTPGSKRSQLHKMYQSRRTAKNSWWWAERLPETCRVVIPIKLEFSASVGFIHKDFEECLDHLLEKEKVISPGLTLTKLNPILAKCMRYIWSLEYILIIYTNILCNGENVFF